MIASQFTYPISQRNSMRCVPVLLVAFTQGKQEKRDTLGEQVASGAVTHFERYEMKGPLETGICEAVRKSTPLRPGGNAP